MSELFQPFKRGGMALRNRIAMAPMTRARTHDGIADDLTSTYYRQRASAGLIVTEGTPISPTAEGFLFIPGIYTNKQIAGWRKTTEAVHAEGGVIFAQLWHVGRVSHVANQPGGIAPVSSTDRIAANSQAWGLRDDGSAGPVDVSRPRALSTEEVRGVIDDFAKAAANAVAAGFDGVELHGANGYLIEQFINPLVNDRTDAYRGDTLVGRTRFLLEAIDAVIARIGAAKTAVRLSPFGGLFDMGTYPEIEETYLHLADELSKRGIAYVHLMDHEIARPHRHPFGLPLAVSGALQRRADPCRRYDARARRTAHRRWPDRYRRLRRALHRQPRPRRPASPRLAARTGRPRHPLRRRCPWLHRLPDL
jgi:2,4-dienoyl-CoA reductase-like NADH-dependent reductase (Old Yellow Enzyme family)